MEPAKSSLPLQQRPLEFDGSVEYYVDKTGNNVQRKWDTLPRLSRPQYKIRLKRIQDITHNHHLTSYYRKKSSKHLARIKHIASVVEPKMTDEQGDEIQRRLRELNTMVANDPTELHNWIELHQLMAHTMCKTNRLAVAEHQLHSLETALQHHAGNEKLLQLYVATASATYPDSQVSSTYSPTSFPSSVLHVLLLLPLGGHQTGTAAGA